jgi:hypothetical protein
MHSSRNNNHNFTVFVVCLDESSKWYHIWFCSRNYNMITMFPIFFYFKDKRYRENEKKSQIPDFLYFFSYICFVCDLWRLVLYHVYQFSICPITVKFLWIIESLKKYLKKIQTFITKHFNVT